MEREIVAPVPNPDEKKGSVESKLEPSLADNMTNYGAGFAKGATKVFEDYLEMAQHPVETMNALNPNNLAMKTGIALTGAAFAHPESQDYIARQIDPFIKAGEKISEAVGGDVTTKGEVAGFVAASVAIPIPTGARATATAEKEAIAAESEIAATLPHTPARPVFIPGTNILDTAIEVMDHIRGKAALRTDADVLAKQIDNASIEAQLAAKKNPLHEAMDRHDRTLTHSGQTIQEKHLYGEWNAAQVNKRADALKSITQQNPDIAQALVNAPKSEMLAILESETLDKYAAIKPYDPANLGRHVLGMSDEELAKILGRELKEENGVFFVNKEFHLEKKSLVELQYLIQQATREDILHMLNPEAPLGPALTQVQHLHAMLEKEGSLSKEARQSLPKPLQALPDNMLAQVKEDLKPLVSPQYRLEGTANSAAAQQANLPAGQVQATPQQLAIAEVLKAQLLKDIEAVRQNSSVATVAAPKSEAALQAQQHYEEHLNEQGAGAKFTKTLLRGLREPVGYLDHGDKSHLLDMNRALAEGEYNGLKANIKNNLRTTANVVAVAGGAAVGGLPVGAAAWAGVVALRFAENYGWTEAMKNTVMPVVENLGQKASHLQDAAKESLVNSFLNTVHGLPKDAQGNLTHEGLQVLNQIDKNVTKSPEFQASVVSEVQR